MSLSDDVKGAAVEELGKLLVRLPFEGVKLLVDLVSNALEDDEPVRYIERRAAAQSSELASEALIEATLAATRPKPQT